ncbi:MAG: ABC transporter ATP-binding protein [Gammaproteobacteria bacterium]|uniref:ABC transporter ATP-binding protein n=1 Tax=Fulvivirga sp. TaxID=1931237 RepID=UPI0032F0995A
MEKKSYVKLLNVSKAYVGLDILNIIKNLYSNKKYKRYTSKKYVLKDISLKITEGEKIGILGENGAGKSTLLKIIAGLVKPSCGEIDISGDVHAVFTLGTALKDELTGRSNIYLSGELHGMSKEDVNLIIDELIDFTGLGEFIDKPVKTYSSGMKARLAFAGLSFISPEILILDETLSTGDQWFQVKAKKMINKLCNNGKIVIVVSHSMEALRNICSRCIWIKDGVVEEDGSPESVIAAYEHYQRSRILESNKLIDKKETWSKHKDISINLTLCKDMDYHNEISSIISNSKLIITIHFAGKINFDFSSISIEITRTDGLLIFQDHSSLSNYRHYDKAKLLKVCIENFALYDGIFEVKAMLYKKNNLIAYSKKTLKVISENKYLGGVPLFNVTSDIQVH